LYLNLPFAMILGWFLSGKEGAESTVEEAQEGANRARALALQAQLQPHTLYNTLGGLAELVREDPEAAEKGLLDLAEMLRVLTRQAVAWTIPLAQERALLRRYLAIEAIRLGDRLKVQWIWPEWADAIELPPLLLQPLVENAVKHGIAPCPEGGELVVEVRRIGSTLILRVTNTGQPLDPTRGEGTGLSNLRERLGLIPGLGGSLALRPEEGRTLAEVRLRAILTP
jgi:sensor histidine kinase YesM